MTASSPRPASRSAAATVVPGTPKTTGPSASLSLVDMSLLGRSSACGAVVAVGAGHGGSERERRPEPSTSTWLWRRSHVFAPNTDGRHQLDQVHQVLVLAQREQRSLRAARGSTRTGRYRVRERGRDSSPRSHPCQPRKAACSDPAAGIQPHCVARESSRLPPIQHGLPCREVAAGQWQPRHSQPEYDVAVGVDERDDAARPGCCRRREEGGCFLRWVVIATVPTAPRLNAANNRGDTATSCRPNTSSCSAVGTPSCANRWVSSGNADPGWAPENRPETSTGVR